MNKKKLAELIDEHRFTLQRIVYGLILAIIILSVFTSYKYFNYKDNMQVANKCKVLENKLEAQVCCYECDLQKYTENYKYLESTGDCLCDGLYLGKVK